ncbi:MAG: hypothetical protein AB7L28_28600, partial [Kofleriaceae bacterium]
MSEHKFRYLLPPGTNFQFVAKFKAWIWLSIVLTIATVAVLFANKHFRGEYMNWTIDFKGGTEIILGFKQGDQFVEVDPGKLRQALHDAGEEGVEVSEMEIGSDPPIQGMVIRTPRFSAIKPEVEQRAVQAFLEAFKDREVSKAVWSGDRISVRSRKSITPAEVAPVLAKLGLEVKPWDQSSQKAYGSADKGTGEYNQFYTVTGLAEQYEQLLEKALAS